MPLSKPLGREGVQFWPLREVVHGDLEISVSLVAIRERSSDVNCDPHKGCSDVLLVYKAPTSNSGTSTGGTGVTLLTLPNNVAP
jgi:hypothetical protein